MNWSVSEIRALATTAARGAGAPPGQAARFGAAAALFLQAGNRPQVLADALDALPGGPIMTFPLAVDRALTAPDGEVALLADGPESAGLLACYVAALPFSARLADDGSGPRLEVDVTRPAAPPGEGRITGCGALVERMTVLAARTFVPESDASRLSGAGAGLTDND